MFPFLNNEGILFTCILILDKRGQQIRSICCDFVLFSLQHFVTNHVNVFADHLLHFLAHAFHVALA